MAEIPIQPKRGSNIWPWVIGALALLLVAWLLLGRGDDDDASPGGADTTGPTSSTMSAEIYASVPLVTTMSRRT